jgi:hypothetical protein
MGIKDTLQFLSSGRVSKGAKIFGSVTPLAGVQLSNSGASYVPILNHLPTEVDWVPFRVWWKKENIFGCSAEFVGG